MKPFIICAVILLLSVPELFAQTKADRYPIIRNEKLGFIDGDGREIIPPQFGNAADSASFREGIANVSSGTGWGYINESGKFVVEPTYWWAYPFSEGFGCVKLPAEGTGYGFIDKTGRLLIKGLETDSHFQEGKAAVRIGEKWGYLGPDMKMAIPPQFELAGPFSEGLAAIRLEKKSGYIDNQGHLVVLARYEMAMPFSNGLGRVKILLERGTTIGKGEPRSSSVYLWGYVNRSGIEVISPKFLNATSFAEGLAFAIPDHGSKSFGIIDKTGNFVYEPAFDQATPFTESLAAVRKGARWGYVNHEGDWVIPPTFAQAEPFWHGLARVAFSEGRWGYIDKNGSVVWQNKNE